jgi:hypothetical protein
MFPTCATFFFEAFYSIILHTNVGVLYKNTDMSSHIKRAHAQTSMRMSANRVWSVTPLNICHIEVNPVHTERI